MYSFNFKMLVFGLQSMHNKTKYMIEFYEVKRTRSW